MTILCVASGKGGTCKTTNAAQLAERRVAQGRRVLLIDTDKQGSMAFWASQRIKAGRPKIPCVSIFGENTGDQVLSHVPHYDDIVIDTRGTEAGNLEMYEALTVAEVVISPIRPGMFDAITTLELSNTMKLVRRVNRKVKAYLMLTAVSTNAKSTRQAELRKELADLPHFDGMLESTLSHRAVFERVAGTGMSVAEFGNDPKAVAELTAFATEVWK
ncbi:AAA family ATPase [Paraburkholderia youngii]|uniref:AAA family ATPase n=1 Tax=Paraburkholderia youngii TaxID=2782701 RepID=UPI001590EDE9|nr:AAA family ATPase [Paraburkholderia youngii]NUX58702.1 AAA family ATPase [Paraburkholderia youngii]